VSAKDIRELIDSSTSQAERAALAETAQRVEDALHQPVPYRAAFRQQLRKQVVAEARRRMSPWYRRSAVWGSALAAAAAVVVLGFGIRLSQSGSAPPEVAAPTPPAENREITRREQPVAPRLTNDRKDLPVIALADEVIPPDHSGPETIADLDVAKGLLVYRLSGRPDQAQFARIATALGFDQVGARSSTEFETAQGERKLRLRADGLVQYQDPETLRKEGSAPAALDPAAAARRFLEQALLPVPSLRPNVANTDLSVGKPAYKVTYTPTVQGRPIVNASTVVQISMHGAVSEVEGYVQTGDEQEGSFAVLEPAAAIDLANRGGGARFSQVDLVYVRTPVEQTAYLQPYWRVFGTTEHDERIMRYVPALLRDEQ
jgi:hypothetical protein